MHRELFVYLVTMLQLILIFFFGKTVALGEGPPAFVDAGTIETKGLDLNTEEPLMEPCPSDSITSGNSCECFHEFCEKPPCNFTLTQLTEATNIPGLCCPTYACIGCPNETTLDGKCQCGKGAVIVPSSGKCECVDPAKSLVDGKCVCNPEKCHLPHVCDQHSVSVVENDGDGCCSVTKCIPCPKDSYSTNYNDQTLEDKCVCSPCSAKTCNDNETAIVFRRGNNLPGSCCDLYTCEPVGGKSSCKSNGTYYKENDVWSPVEGETCRCQNGISFCYSTKKDQKQNDNQPCISDGKVIPHATSWMENDDCTSCKCLNGEIKCISHFCDVIEDKINNPAKETHVSCILEDKVYSHSESWTFKDECSLCTCQEGEIHCVQQSPCEKESPSKTFCISGGKTYKNEEVWSDGACTKCTCLNGTISCTKNESFCNNDCISINGTVYPDKTFWREDECTNCICMFGNAKCMNVCTTSTDCPKFESCKKKCEYGFKTNKKGCEICKCKIPSNTSGFFKEDFPILESILKMYNISENDVVSLLKNFIATNENSSPRTTTSSNSFVEKSDVAANGNVDEDKEKLTMFLVGFSGGVLLALVFAISMCIFKIHKQRTQQKFSPCDYKLVDVIEMDKNKNISSIYTQKNFELKNVT